MSGSTKPRETDFKNLIQQHELFRFCFFTPAQKLHQSKPSFYSGIHDNPEAVGVGVSLGRTLKFWEPLQPNSRKLPVKQAIVYIQQLGVHSTNTWQEPPRHPPPRRGGSSKTKWRGGPPRNARVRRGLEASSAVLDGDGEAEETHSRSTQLAPL